MKAKSLAKTAVTASLVSALAIVLVASRAEAASSIACAVSSVEFQQSSGSPAELLYVTCSNSGGTIYMMPVGAQDSCHTDIGTVHSVEALALTAKLTATTLTIWYTSNACGGSLGTQNIINSVTYGP